MSGYIISNVSEKTKHPVELEIPGYFNQKKEL
jgi:hypothetical protein